MMKIVLTITPDDSPTTLSKKECFALQSELERESEGLKDVKSPDIQVIIQKIKANRQFLEHYFSQ